ncbi:hypothetical protein [Ulvibacter antarcticus]|uniref:Uncharacterized protein n=1 Tax=Ulvibacter antarcticus TaxID=442714 RepID=A0A3L9YF92_9FLAO|nr:hypothetical protein [Ulvibacter antarcticus]RMA57789.1 hypothetical protein BXY75_2594 [Ulvibacter antarcticus]
MKTLIKPLLSIFSVTLFLIVFASCEHPVPPPGQVISYEEADGLENNYISTRYDTIGQILGYQDTREFWFSLDTLKKYIEYVEYEAGERNLDNLGIRIYLAAYPPSPNGDDTFGYTTVFLTPTSPQEPSPLRKGFAPIQENEGNIEGISPLNMGHGGLPPNNY